MNANEIVRALRDKCKDCSMRKICLKGEGPLYYCPVKQAADLIESLQAQLAASQRRADAAVEDMKLIVDAVREEHCDETCCFACAFDCDTSINDSGVPNCECPGFERDDCFEWRGVKEENKCAQS